MCFKRTTYENILIIMKWNNKNRAITETYTKHFRFGVIQSSTFAPFFRHVGMVLKNECICKLNLFNSKVIQNNIIECLTALCLQSFIYGRTLLIYKCFVMFVFQAVHPVHPYLLKNNERKSIYFVQKNSTWIKSI